MNKQGPSKIDYCDYTWNPISGCLHGCDYCYLKRMAKRFKDILKPAFHEERMKDPLSVRSPSIIFVGSSGDMFGDWVNGVFINKVIKTIALRPEHTFLFLTKNPKRYGDFIFPDNAWLGTTFDGLPFTRLNLKYLSEIPHHKKWGSFEPMKGQPNETDKSFARKLDWFVIGADSTRGVKRPPSSWGHRLLGFAERCEIPTWVKNNWPELPRIKERPF